MSPRGQVYALFLRRRPNNTEGMLKYKPNEGEEILFNDNMLLRHEGKQVNYGKMGECSRVVVTPTLSKTQPINQNKAPSPLPNKTTVSHLWFNPADE